MSPIPNNQGIPTGGYFFRDLPFLALWGMKYFPFWHPFAAGDTNAVGIPVTTPSFIDTVAQGNLPNVSFVDPAFDTESNGTSADDHPLADIRLGERFIADTYHALASAGYLDNTVLVVTFDEWGGFYDHVPPPRVIDDTNPADVDHTGDGTTPTDGQLVPDYTQLGFRVPAIVVSNLARRQVAHHGPFEHASTLKLIETTFGLHSLTARDAHAENLGKVLDRSPRHRVPADAIPTSSQVLGPVSDPAAICSADSVQSVAPTPVRVGRHPGPRPRSRHPGGRRVPGWPGSARISGRSRADKAADGQGHLITTSRPPRSPRPVTSARCHETVPMTRLPSSALSGRMLTLFLTVVLNVRSWTPGLLASMAPDRARPGPADRAACSSPGQRPWWSCSR